MRKKRITFIYLGTKGAGPVYSIEMAKALSEKCILQIFISSYITNLEMWKLLFLNNENIEINIIKTYKNVVEFVLSYFNINLIKDICKKIRSFKPDAIYSTFPPLWGPILYRKLNDFRKITTIHDVIPHNERLNIPFLRWITDDIIRLSNDIIILNNRDKTILQNKYNKNSKNICVIPHANYSYYSHCNFTNPQNHENNTFELKNNILFIGRIEKYKGINLLLGSFEDVIKINPNLKLIIAGDGDLNPYKNQLDKIKDNVYIINRWIKDEEFQKIIEQCDIIVIPYIEATQSGIIPLAFSFGKPVIATDVGAISEQVPADTGILIKPIRNQLTCAIIQLYENPNLIFQYGQNAKKFSNNEMRWDSSADKLIEFITI